MITKFFNLHEFVSRNVYDGFELKASMFLDPKLFVIADYMRARFGSVKINDWFWGGKFEYSGLRPIEDCPVGATYSQHKYGRAIDLKFKDVDLLEVRQDLAEFKDTYRLLGITTVENGTPSWLHIDTRYTGVGEIKYFDA